MNIKRIPAFIILLALSLVIAPVHGQSDPTGSFKVVTTRTIDDGGGNNVGRYSSLELDSDGNPVISYFDTDLGALKLMVCEDVFCNERTIQIVDNTVEDVGRFSSLKLTPDDRPVIAYYDRTNFDVRVAICNDVTCTNPTLKTIADEDISGQSTSLALDSNNNPVVGYLYTNNAEARLAVCNDPLCDAVTIRTIDTVSAIENGDPTNITIAHRGISLVLNSNDHPVLSYFYRERDENFNTIAQELQIAFCSDATCTQTPTIVTLDTDVSPIGIDLTLDENDKPFVGFGRTPDFPRLVDVVSCDTPTCDNVIIPGYVPGSADFSLQATSIVLNPLGNPVISYQNDAGGLSLVTCQDPACTFGFGTTPILQVVDNNADVGNWSSLEIDGNGNPIISYFDDVNDSLKLYTEASIDNLDALAVIESGGIDSFSLMLGTSPSGTVEFDITSSNTDEAIVSTSSLLFNSTNAFTAQAVNVIGINDDQVDGAQTVDITISVDEANTTATEFIGLPDRVISVVNQDNDTAEISITATDGQEDDTDGAFTLTTTKQFAAPVVVDFTIDRASTARPDTDYKALGTSVTFPANTNTAAIPVIVAADTLVEDPETIILTLQRTDNPSVSIATQDTATVTINDNDVLDETPPVIELLGDAVQDIVQGGDYVEAGAIATDNVDGDISNQIVIDASAVDTSTIGDYAVTYNVTDAAGNSAVEVTRTVSVVDDPAPEFVSTYPENGAVDVPVEVSVEIVVDEPVSATGNGELEFVCQPNDYQVPRKIFLRPTNKYFFDPLQDLPYNSDCLFRVPIIIAQDSQGNLLVDSDGVDDGWITLMFSTVSDAPRITQTTPEQGAVDVQVDATISLTLTELPTSITQPVLLTCDNENQQFTAIPDPQTPNTYILTPTNQLPFDASCALTIPTDGVRDADNNPLEDSDGTLDGTYTLAFTTEVAPQITSTIPAHEAQAIDPTTTITLVANEIMTTTGQAPVTLNCGGDNLLFALDAVNAPTYVLTPLAPLPTDATCTLTIPVIAVADLDGNNILAANSADHFILSFTIGGAAAPIIEGAATE